MAELFPRHSNASQPSGDTPPLPARRGLAVAQVRGVLAERVVISTPLDPFLSLRAAASYSGLSVRKLRDCLGDSMHPLPHYRVGGKILIRVSELNGWMARYRHSGHPDVEKIVADALREL